MARVHREVVRQLHVMGIAVEYITYFSETLDRMLLTLGILVGSPTMSRSSACVSRTRTRKR